MDFFDLLIHIKVIFFDLPMENRLNLVKFNQKLVDFNQISESTFNWNPILTLKSKTSLYRHPNVDSLESKSLTIRFVGPNCLSLVNAAHELKIAYEYEARAIRERQLTWAQLLKGAQNLKTFFGAVH